LSANGGTGKQIFVKNHQLKTDFKSPIMAFAIKKLLADFPPEKKPFPKPPKCKRIEQDGKRSEKTAETQNIKGIEAI
jgi:hypothetical protein